MAPRAALRELPEHNKPPSPGSCAGVVPRRGLEILVRIVVDRDPGNLTISNTVQARRRFQAQKKAGAASHGAERRPGRRMNKISRRKAFAPTGVSWAP